MTSEGLTPPNRQPFVLRWLVVRVIAPLCVALVLLHFTRDVRDPGDRGNALLWTVFIVHLTGVFTAPKTNVLDVGAFSSWFRSPFTLQRWNAENTRHSSGSRLCSSLVFMHSSHGLAVGERLDRCTYQTACDFLTSLLHSPDSWLRL